MPQRIRSFPMCAHGNCNEDGRRLVLSVRSGDGIINERKDFCSFTHAALWALAQAQRSRRTERMKNVTVKRQGRHDKWAVYVDGKVLKGGFISYNDAIGAANEMVRQAIARPAAAAEDAGRRPAGEHRRKIGSGQKVRWEVTMTVEAPESEDANSIVELIENALDDDAILVDLLDITDVTATKEEDE